ncbi:hypothetical protein MMC10_010599 [Thelotrema lepadinum]|nr:hypothetical protein [Thelotrema lepadinum]
MNEIIAEVPVLDIQLKGPDNPLTTVGFVREHCFEGLGISKYLRATARRWTSIHYTIIAVATPTEPKVPHEVDMADSGGTCPSWYMWEGPDGPTADPAFTSIFV